MKFFGRLFIGLYRAYVRVTCKCFTLLISGAFAQLGSRTVLALPIRLSGEERIAIGEGVYVGAGSWLQSLPDGDDHSVALSIGAGTSIAGACVISAVRSVTLQEKVLLARNVYISDHSHRFTQLGTPILAQGIDRIRPVLIKKGAWLAQNVVVCPGVTVGEGAVVGANSVVTDDIPDFSVAVGAPARVVKALALVAK